MPRNLPTPPPERLRIPGPAGALGITLEMPDAEPRAAMLHLHPLTTQGGSRRNNVVRHGALGTLDAGCAALRLDFRGAGDSEGAFDEGRGEVEDAGCAYDWLGERLPGIPKFVWGYSFGSLVGLRFAQSRYLEVSGYLGFALPSALYPLPSGPGWPERMAFLVGSLDDYVDLEALEPLRARGAGIEVLEGAGHFFPEELAEVRRFTAGTLASWL